MGTGMLKVGAEIGWITPEDLAQSNSEMKSFFEKLMRGEAGETIVRAAGSFLTDASGNTSSLAAGGGGVYDVPVGFDAFLTRLSVDYEGSNANTPVACDLRICADQVTPAALRALFKSVPAVYEASKSHAPMFRGGQRVVVALGGGPATTALYVNVQVILTPRRQPITAADLGGV